MVLVTGSMGLVGSEAVDFYLRRGHRVVGIDNDMRSKFFGKAGSVRWNLNQHKNYIHYYSDIRDAGQMMRIMKKHRPALIIHAAAQPSHDWAVKNPVLDFQINAEGTLYLLEAYRQFSPKAVFIHCSTNKVYGNSCNQIGLIETPTRYIPNDESWEDGIDEEFPIDNSLHSLFGVSKLSADIMVQEYGKYFGLKTGVFRCGCITGRRHSGVELHGFLSYIYKCREMGKRYMVYGYNGKQVRDNIHAFDLINAFDYFKDNPREGEVYNMGGGVHSNISVMEALIKAGVDYDYCDVPRIGDHKWWISDVSKFKRQYPGWDYIYDIHGIMKELDENTLPSK